jgi:hypothetical protein
MEHELPASMTLDETEELIHSAGYQVYAAFGTNEAMRTFAETYIPRDRLRDVDLIWDGIGGWRA